MKKLCMAAACVGAVLVLSSCDDAGPFDRARQDFHYSYPLQPGGRLEIGNANGSVAITGWDRNQIDVTGTKYAPSDSELAEIQIKVDVRGDSASIHTEAPRGMFWGGFSARYVIRVPKQTVLDRAETTNGSVSIEDLEGGGHVRSTNGQISMARDTGDYDVHTTNGSIELNECSGSERAGTTNGHVRGRLREGAINARSTNGGIDLTILKPQDGKPLRVSTTNGGITLALAEFHDNTINLETSNGGVTLRLPPDTNAQLTATGSHSRIITDLPLATTGEMGKHDLRGRLGNGGPLISARTSTGGIHIEKH